MNLNITCFLDEERILRKITCNDSARSLPLYIHLSQSIGREIGKLIDVKLTTDEIFSFEGSLFHAAMIDNMMSDGQILFISNTYIKAKIFENVLNQLDLGLQIFDRRGHLIFLNESCRRIESLIKQNVIDKHLRDIYTVNEGYSTILTTIKHKTAINNRCDIFANRFGDEVTSINSGFPLYIEDQFFGAFGVVLDMDALMAFTSQQKILQQYLKSSKDQKVQKYRMNNYYTFDDMIGISDGIKDAVEIAKKVSGGDFSVLLLGETGTGKELFAQSIHSASRRKDENFIAINCSAIPSTILESTLFGTVKGSFTGSSNQKGLLDEANGGTLFLDEINAMDIHMQSKLLRVLQEKNFRRVGGLKDIACDFRVITAMNETADRAISENRLREDLFYRLNTITIEIPALRERVEDIPVLTEYYIGKLSRAGEKTLEGLTDDAYAALMNYSWPGNIRELFHMLEYAYTISETNWIDTKHLPERLLMKLWDYRRKNNLHHNDHNDLNKRLQEQEKRMIEEALSACENNVSKAADFLNLSRQNLQYRIRKCGIKRVHK